MGAINYFEKLINPLVEQDTISLVVYSKKASIRKCNQLLSDKLRL